MPSVGGDKEAVLGGGVQFSSATLETKLTINRKSEYALMI